MTMGMQASYYAEFPRMQEVKSRLRCGPLTVWQLRRGLVEALALAVQAGWVRPTGPENNGLFALRQVPAKEW